MPEGQAGSVIAACAQLADPDALDSLGRALWWQGRTAAAIESRKEA